MINVEINRNYIGNIYKFKVEGHSGYAEAGRDVVCAVVSAVTQSVVLGLTEILGIRLNIIIDEGRLECELPEIFDSLVMEKSNILLETMLITLKQAVVEYPDFIKLTETEE
jgi:uncharacterized protein YsxB (DUF464 family)